MTLTITGNSFSGNGTGLIPLAGAPHIDEKSDNTALPPSQWRNFYYDSDGDLAFTSPGDTSGNTNASLALNKAISSTQVLNFYVDNDGGTTIGANFAANAYRLTGLTVRRSDGSTVALDVTQGTPQTFTDPSGGNWQVALNGVGYLEGATTDIVGNIDSVPDGEGPDYHFMLTISYSAFSTFDDWAADFGIPNDADDDSDHDGIQALTEYGIGYNPTVSETLPGLVPSGADFTVTWPKGATAAADLEISYVVEVSSELQVWGAPESGELVESGTELVLTLPAGQGKTFARLKVVRTP
jgi:hypothetical protein